MHNLPGSVSKKSLESAEYGEGLALAAARLTVARVHLQGEEANQATAFFSALVLLGTCFGGPCSEQSNS